MSESIEPRNVSMYPSDWAVVQKLNDDLDLRNLSLALRMIVRDWQKQQQATQPIDQRAQYKAN